MRKRGKPQLAVYDTSCEDSEPVGTFSVEAAGVAGEELEALPSCVWQEDSNALAVADLSGSVFLLSR